MAGMAEMTSGFVRDENGALVTGDGPGVWKSGFVRSEGGGLVVTLPPSAVSRDGASITADAANDGIVLTSPDYTDTMRRLLRLVDEPENRGRLLQIDHYGTPDGTSQNYGLEIHNFPGANSPHVIHQYSGAAPALWIDNTDSAPTIKVKNAENPTLNPGRHGSGDFFELSGYYAWGQPYADGVVTSGTSLASATANWTPEDVGKPITVGAVTTTIATRVSATQVTLAAPATNGTGVVFSYARRDSDLRMLTLDKSLVWRNSSSVAMQIINSSGDKGVLKIGQLASSTNTALEVTNPGTGTALRISQAGNSANGAFRIDLQSTAASTWGALVTGQQYGIAVTTTADNAAGVALSATKTATGVGTVARLRNSGTGLTLDVQSGTTSVWAVTKAGLPQWVAAGNVQTTVGAAGAAAATPATPSKYLKVVGDDGTTYVIPAYAAA